MPVHFIGNPSNAQIGIVLYEIVQWLILKRLLNLNQSNLMHKNHLFWNWRMFRTKIIL